MTNEPIGVFDSGVGGLTVLKELYRLMPSENYIYLGDTLRLPYGIKPKAEVASYCIEAYNFFKSKKAKAMVIACNTATAAGLEEVLKIADIPTIGVIESGAIDAVKFKQNHIGIIATDGTIKSGIYQNYLKSFMPGVKISAIGCPELVFAVENGQSKTPIGRAVTFKYLDMLEEDPDTIILACTHFPTIAMHVIEYYKEKGKDINITNPATKTAETLKAKIYFSQRELSTKGKIEFYVTNNAENFKTVGNNILDGLLKIDEVKIANLEKY